MKPRNRRFRLALAVSFVAALLLAGLYQFIWPERDPVHNGRRLSEWIALYDGTLPDSLEHAQASKAIQSIGTNSLSLLVKWMEFESPAWRWRVARWAQSLPNWISDSTLVSRLSTESEAEVRADHAMEAFKALGPIASPAIPQISRLATVPQAGVSSRALYALSCVGQEALVVFTNVLSDNRFAGDPWMMVCVENLGTNAYVASPVIASYLTHTNTTVAVRALHMLLSGDTNSLDPALLVPTLIRCLNDSRLEVRRLSPFALTRFETLASPALPALTNALDDPDLEVQTQARGAIEAIQFHIQHAKAARSLAPW